ncbi:IS1380 family transposase [Companilactobacillus huachuanensis]|uniref:IS1380 family transposase n=1 Tax=Companilactobacillus huachuanensis TaxID=2559914 RepID=A0ABW1RLI2_9LACO|nr:IS1380 family transposase [Companilactobacillus huachuanensis]
MNNILDYTLDFNHNISFCDDGTELTNDAGLLLLKDHLIRINLEQMIKDDFSDVEWRSHPRYHRPILLTQIVLQKIAGYPNDSMANSLKEDPVFKLCLGPNNLASQPTISRFINCLDSRAIDSFNELNMDLNQKLIMQKNQTEQLIDVDSTHCDTYGDQNESSYNAHYSSVGFHPLVAFDGLSGMFLGAQLRPGNVYTSTGVVDFLRPIIDFYKRFTCDMNVLIRGDSGFATPELYQLCLSQKVNLLIKLKANARLDVLADKYAQNIALDDFKSHYFNLNYRASSWSDDIRPRVVLKATRHNGELFCRYEFLVTTLTELSVSKLFHMYNNRGVAENFIKEAKRGFGFDNTNSHNFQANQVRMWLAILSYTITLLFKNMVLPKSMRTKTVNTIRFYLFHIAGRVTSHACKILIHLSHSNPSRIIHKIIFLCSHGKMIFCLIIKWLLVSFIICRLILSTQIKSTDF